MTEQARPLSPRQAEVYDVIMAYHHVTHEPIPVRVLARRLGMHHETARSHLATLHARGWLKSETSATPADTTA